MKLPNATSHEHAVRKRGFTLIELAIVIVVIGLVIGGVMAGRDIIRQTETRKIVSQSQELFSKINIFKLKYNAMPGEFLTYQNFFSTLIGPYCPKTTWNPGVINDIIDNTYEMGAAMAQLHAAGLIEMGRPQILQNGTVLDHYDCPYSNQQSWAGITTPWSNIWLSITSSALDNKNTLSWGDAYNPALTVLEAKMMDEKVDDGMPFTGRMQTFRTPTTGYCTSTADYTNKATIYYLPSLNLKTCQPYMLNGI